MLGLPGLRDEHTSIVLVRCLGLQWEHRSKVYCGGQRHEHGSTVLVGCLGLRWERMSRVYGGCLRLVDEHGSILLVCSRGLR